ncbi:4Fe-4S dicluster domain-containing protein [Symbiobacterium terraclitae]|uniref:4Fe-4S dicluster domain-containing protein n=1 Tax=Symbiobacterium terraclitae TaxID=557451 RepID=UPI0035B52CC6
MAGTQIPPLPAGAEHPDADLLLRMSADLRRALAKPVHERRWVMVIDLRKCIGCHACTVSCIAENKLPPGVVYRPVIEQEVGSYPHLSRVFTPRPCMQCDNPPCVPVCPVAATFKRPDGVVEVDYESCIGCRYCIAACPYNARSFDFGEYYTTNTPGGVQDYEKAATFEYGKKRVRDHEDSPIGNARKCHFCVHRLEEGMLPACTSTCIGRATFFGDANDTESLVHELLGKPNVRTLRPEAGTKPRVYYLI